MNIFDLIAGLCLVLAAIPAFVFLHNHYYFRPTLRPTPRSRPSISIVIPARNESANIADALKGVLVCEGVEFEIVVVDDCSDDDTVEQVQVIAANDARVRLVSAPPLPAGWCGKQLACQVGADAALHDFIMFLDADVRLGPSALAHMIDEVQATGVDLLSGFPRQLTKTWMEKLLIPLIHFVLLCFLPLGRMRWRTKPGYAAGCGQLFLARRSAYEEAGGHGAIRASLMDGIALPRAMRNLGRRTDLIDAMPFAECRMYHNAREVWMGLSKNASEGIASPGKIIPITLVLLGGQVLPFVLLSFLPLLDRQTILIASCAVLLAYLPRLIGTIRFRESIFGALLHPVGITLLLAIQWFALMRSILGLSSSWRGRSYGSTAELVEHRNSSF